MSTYMHIDKTDVTAAKETQVQFNRSPLPFSQEVREIEKQIEGAPDDPALWMQKGIALSKQMLFLEAVEAYSEGLQRDPFHALTYRHRGHRYISLRRYPEAAADLELSARLDPANWSTWYHLGLAYYLMGDYRKAAPVYQRCLDMTDKDEDLVAVVDWYWMTAKRLGDEMLADRLLAMVTPKTDPGENYSYQKRILMYQGLLTPGEVMQFEGAEHPELEIATQGYGVSNYYYLNGDLVKSNELLKQILSIRDFWGAFGYLAALSDAKARGLDYEARSES